MSSETETSESLQDCREDVHMRREREERKKKKRKKARHFSESWLESFFSLSV